MMSRNVFDLGIARTNEPITLLDYEYLYIGECDGVVGIRFNSPRASCLNPDEFDKITDISHLNFIFITNTAQAGKQLVIYFETKENYWQKWL